jgi:hypothetical protein
LCWLVQPIDLETQERPDLAHGRFVLVRQLFADDLLPGVALAGVFLVGFREVDHGLAGKPPGLTCVIAMHGFSPELVAGLGREVDEILRAPQRQEAAVFDILEGLPVVRGADENTLARKISGHAPIGRAVAVGKA